IREEKKRKEEEKKKKESETQQKAEAAPEDSDFIGISPEPPLGTVHRPLDRIEISICTASFCYTVYFLLRPELLILSMLFCNC
uniref:Dynein cytoplasmic 1 intermediate chain 1 n=1 Tax=Sinocyclocheilus rhinocerous TaxID=307959 RepID=A0A673HT66_9TELE